MAGGRGTRLDTAGEKPLFEVAGTAMIDRVLDAIERSRIETAYVATSPATPQTRAHVSAPVIRTPGDGYVADLESALADDRLARPVLTVAADLPLLPVAVLNEISQTSDSGSLTGAVPVGLKEALGVSVDATLPEPSGWAPAGLNVVADGSERVFRSWDARLAINVNRRGDASVAETVLLSPKN